MDTTSHTGSANALAFRGVKGDGLNDDTAGLQAALDSGAGTVCLPKPPVGYRISKTLRIHSGQTLWADRQAVIRLMDGADAHLLANADPDRGDRGITVCGGIWDGNNEHQSPHGPWAGKTYDPARFVGVLMRFDHVQDLTLRGLTLKDPESFAVQLGRLKQFTVEDITFDFNMLRKNMDGIHVHGPAEDGRIANLKGATNDDMVALNADDGGMYEMSRGPIRRVSVDGLFCENGYTAVRLLSCGSPVSQIRLSNIFGTYRYNVVSFTHHNVHPGEPSTLDDIVIDGVFCSKPTEPLPRPLDGGDEWGRTTTPLIWVCPGVHVRNACLRNLHRRERLERAADTIIVDTGAVVEYLDLADVTLLNQASTPVDLLVNKGEIKRLHMVNVFARAEGAPPRGWLLRNAGTIGVSNLVNCEIENLAGMREG